MLDSLQDRGTESIGIGVTIVRRRIVVIVMGRSGDHGRAAAAPAQSSGGEGNIGRSGELPLVGGKDGYRWRPPFLVDLTPRFIGTIKPDEPEQVDGPAHRPDETADRAELTVSPSHCDRLQALNEDAGRTSTVHKKMQRRIRETPSSRARVQLGAPVNARDRKRHGRRSGNSESGARSVAIGGRFKTSHHQTGPAGNTSSCIPLISLQALGRVASKAQVSHAESRSDDDSVDTAPLGGILR